jgi:hypothetical protein
VGQPASSPGCYDGPELRAVADIVRRIPKLLPVSRLELQQQNATVLREVAKLQDPCREAA